MREMPYRTLGRTGEHARRPTSEACTSAAVLDEGASIRIIRTAIENGVTLVDASWD